MEETAVDLSYCEEGLIDDDEIEFLVDLVAEYLERDGLTQPEWAWVKDIHDKLETWLDIP